MRWWINKDGGNTGEIFDDRITEPPIYENGPGPGPGDEGFRRDGIDAELARLRKKEPVITWSADYMDRSWPEVIEFPGDEA